MRPSMPSLSCVLWTLVIIAVGHVGGDVAIFNLQNKQMELRIRDAPALFGGDIPNDGLRGLLVYSQPADACQPVLPPPKNLYNTFGKWFLLLQRNSCSFELKVRNAQAAGYHAAIVHNYNSSNLDPMGADNKTGIYIPAVLIGSEDGYTLRDNFLYDSGFYACIEPDSPFDITMHMLLIFSLLVGVCFFGAVVFILVKFFKERRRQRHQCLPKSSLNKLTEHTFKEDSPYETCIICLDNYAVGDLLLILPCMHAYHKKCITPWLTKRKRVCPLCKRKVIFDSENTSDSESDNEHQPLIRGSSNNEGSTSTGRRNIHGLLVDVLGYVRNSSNSSSSSVSPASSSPSPSLVSSTIVTTEELTRWFEAYAEDNETPSLHEEPSVNA